MAPAEPSARDAVICEDECAVNGSAWASVRDGKRLQPRLVMLSGIPETGPQVFVTPQRP